MLDRIYDFGPGQVSAFEVVVRLRQQAVVKRESELDRFVPGMLQEIEKGVFGAAELAGQFVKARQIGRDPFVVEQPGQEGLHLRPGMAPDAFIRFGEAFIEKDQRLGQLKGGIDRFACQANPRLRRPAQQHGGGEGLGHIEPVAGFEQEQQPVGGQGLQRPETPSR